MFLRASVDSQARSPRRPPVAVASAEPRNPANVFSGMPSLRVENICCACRLRCQPPRVLKRFCDASGDLFLRIRRRPRETPDVVIVLYLSRALTAPRILSGRGITFTWFAGLNLATGFYRGSDSHSCDSYFNPATKNGSFKSFAIYPLRRDFRIFGRTAMIR